MEVKMKIQCDRDAIVLLCAFKYALGKSNYVVCDIACEIEDNWVDMPTSYREFIQNEIKSAIDKNMAGMECDRIAWQRILKL